MNASDAPRGRMIAGVSLGDRLKHPEGVLSRTDLRKLGFERRGIDAIFRAVPVIAIPGYARPLIRVSDFLTLLDESTYRDDRVRK